MREANSNPVKALRQENEQLKAELALKNKVLMKSLLGMDMTLNG